ncbi:MAG: hypothetical protein LBC30_04035 [Puniceicoccales bacterium]|jgi:hypothetical protein|nr:hypothetical protein [Puniceicoccales bacterium]
MTSKKTDSGKVKTKTAGGRNPDRLKHMVVELHNIMGMIWNIWKEIAMGSHLVTDRYGLEGYERKSTRLIIGIGVKK